MTTYYIYCFLNGIKLYMNDIGEWVTNYRYAVIFKDKAVALKEASYYPKARIDIY